MSLAHTAALFLAAALAASGCAGNLDDATVPVAGTDWVLVALGGEAAKPGDIPAARPSLHFDAREQRVSGSTGVNRLSGAYERSGAALTFGPMAVTRRAGPPELMAQETAFLQALGAAARAEVAEGALILRDASGEELARFENRERP